MPMGDFFEEFFVLAELFNPLKLTDGEIGIFTALLAMCPGEILFSVFITLWYLKLGIRCTL